MGLFSSKKSTAVSTSNTAVDQVNSNVSDIDAPAVVGRGNIVSFSDQGAIQAAVDMQQTGAVFLGETFASALGFVERSNETAIKNIVTSSDNALDKVGDAFEESKGTVNMEVILVLALAFPVAMMLLTNRKAA